MRKLIEKLKKEYPVGTRVVLRKMDDKQAPPIGTKGTVLGVDDIGSIMVAWDNGSSLSVVYREDVCDKIVTDTIKQQIEKIRLSGKTNMIDANVVQYYANQMRFHELVIFLEEEKQEYFKYLLQQK